MWKPAEPLAMSADQLRTLQGWVRAQNTPQSVVLRARIALLAAGVVLLSFVIELVIRHRKDDELK